MIICVGDTLFWNDPDDGICSKYVDVVSIDENVITVSDNGAQFEVFSSELSHTEDSEEHDEEDL